MFDIHRQLAVRELRFSQMCAATKLLLHYSNSFSGPPCLSLGLDESMCRKT